MRMTAQSNYTVLILFGQMAENSKRALEKVFLQKYGLVPSEQSESPPKVNSVV